MMRSKRSGTTLPLHLEDVVRLNSNPAHPVERHAALMTPDDAMAVVRAWTESRVVGAAASTTLEILAAFSVRILMAAWPKQIDVALAWSDPVTVELTVSCSPYAGGLEDGPNAHLADCLSDLSDGWTFHHTPEAAYLVSTVEDRGADD